MIFFNKIMERCGYVPKASIDTEVGWHPLSMSRRTRSGKLVSPETAMRVSAVYACVKILAETIATLPLVVYERTGDGGKRKATEHWLYGLLHDEPNEAQTAFEFKEMMEGHLALRGNAYAEIEGQFAGRATQLIPLHPDRVRVEKTKAGVIRYEVSDIRAGSRRIVERNNMLHIKGLSSDGIKGLSPIQQAAEAVGLSMAAEEFGAAFFGSGASAGNVLEHPGKLSDKARNNMRDSLREQHVGTANAFKTLILEENMKWQQLGIKPNEGQFIETRKFQVSDIARIFRIPPHLIGDLEKSTFNNIEQQSLEFVIYTMLPWFARWEQAITRALLVQERDKYFVEFMVDGLLRGNIKDRYIAYTRGIQWGFISRNEVREKENLERKEGLDDFLIPMNMRVVGEEQEVKQPPGTGQAPFAIMINDIARRAAGAEDKIKAEPGTKRFADFIGRYQIYVGKILIPLAEVVKKETGMEMDSERIVELIIDTYGTASSGREEKIAEIIEESLLISAGKEQ